MPILSEGYLTTQDLMRYVKEKHNRHWNKCYISVLIKKKALPIQRLGKQNIFSCEDVDSHISTLTRSCASGVRGIKYKQ